MQVRRDGRGDHHPPATLEQVDRVDDAVVGQIDDRARSISVRTSILVHRPVIRVFSCTGSWSSGVRLSRQHPSQQDHRLFHASEPTLSFTTSREVPSSPASCRPGHPLGASSWSGTIRRSRSHSRSRNAFGRVHGSSRRGQCRHGIPGGREQAWCRFFPAIPHSTTDHMSPIRAVVRFFMESRY